MLCFALSSLKLTLLQNWRICGEPERTTNTLRIITTPRFTGFISVLGHARRHMVRGCFFSSIPMLTISLSFSQGSCNGWRWATSTHPSIGPGHSCVVLGSASFLLSLIAPTAQGPALQGYFDAVDEDNEDLFVGATIPDDDTDDASNAPATDADNSSDAEPPLDSYPDYATDPTSIQSDDSDDSVPTLLSATSGEGHPDGSIFAIDLGFARLRRPHGDAPNDGEFVERPLGESEEPLGDVVNRWLRNIAPEV